MQSVVIIQKQCRECFETKDITLFKKHRKTCICCYKKYMKQYYLEKKKDIKENKKEYYKNNQEKLKKYAKNYYSENRELIKTKNLNYYHKNNE